MDYSQQPSLLYQADLALNDFIHKVYMWMSAGLAVTGAVALYMAAHPAMIVHMMQNQVLFWGMLIAQLGCVFVLAGMVQKMEANTAKAMFLFYAALTGITTSVIFLIYTRGSIANTFFVTAGTFAVMSIWGYSTKKDLTSMGHLLFMGLVGIIIASIANIFVHSSAMDKAVTYIGVVVFTGLTAYDTQRIKSMYVAGTQGEEETKEAILGALALYLDFINLFLELLKLMGDRRD
ncbi:MAG: Bax inhibitor-1/YccA family protein [Elusimicrobia bacterium]|nr:Bax inhibitor-1/YccA family protein [Elusimicrobiota bacterium]